METILVIDASQNGLGGLQHLLSYEGYRVLTAHSSQEALERAQVEAPDLFIVDGLQLGVGGIEVARRLRAEERAPILMLAPSDAVEDRVAGLDNGADDCLARPFIPSELFARLRALLRRNLRPHGPPGSLAYAGLVLDPATREVTRGARRCSLTPKELELLTYFMRHVRQVLRREDILRAVWGQGYSDPNVLDVYVGYLRTKLEGVGEGRLIYTVRGVGYILREPSE